MIWRRGVVEHSYQPWRGVQELSVVVAPAVGGRTRVKALAYVETTGSAQPGDAVLLNATALHRNLGTGGYAFVVAIPDRLPHDPPEAPGHIVKARYTATQDLRLGVEEEESEHHSLFTSEADLEGMPVITAALHSALPAIIAGLRQTHPSVRVSYIMTDGAALPYALSRTAAALAEAGWIEASITAAQSYGGDHEAVNIYTALLTAKHVVGADVAIVAQGPGSLGTGTALGFSSTDGAEALAAAHLLGGRPVGSLRISQADVRSRHHGVSHHSTTVYGRLTLVPATIVVPILPGEFGEKIRSQVLPLHARHDLVWTEAQRFREALDSVPVPLSTMGRTLAEDPTPFLAAAAAGGYVGDLLSRER